MPNKQSRFLIDTYFAAFNAGDTKKMESLVAEDLIHDVNQGERREGKEHNVEQIRLAGGFRQPGLLFWEKGITLLW